MQKEEVRHFNSVRKKGGEGKEGKRESSGGRRRGKEKKRNLRRLNFVALLPSSSPFSRSADSTPSFLSPLSSFLLFPSETNDLLSFPFPPPPMASHSSSYLFSLFFFLLLFTFLTFRRVEPLGPAAVLGVVVHEHVVGDGQEVALHARVQGHHHLREREGRF